MTPTNVSSVVPSIRCVRRESLPPSSPLCPPSPACLLSMEWSFRGETCNQAYDIEMPENLMIPDELIEFPQQTEPPYQGFGTEEDSIASFYRLVPKTAKFDALKQVKDLSMCNLLYTCHEK